MSTRAPAPVQGPAATGGYPRRWFAAAAMMAAVLMDMVDVTIVNVALPTIRHDLGASATQLEWVVSAYMLAFAAVLITAGSLGDLFGRKRLFLAGIAVFGLASLGAGLSQSAGELIAARVVQGAAAAVMTPQLLATFRTMFTGRERGQAFGIYGAVLGLASAVGLLLGGVLTSADLFGWGWRSVFFVNLPIAVAALAGSARLMPSEQERSTGRIDFAGTALLTGALVAITYPLLEGRSLGWPAWCWALLAAGIAGLAVLGLIEVRRQHTRVAPLIRTPLFRIPAFTTGLIVQLAFAAGLQGFFLIFTLWVQTGQHYSPLRAGLTATAFSVGSFVLAPQAAPLAQRFGRLVLATGAVLFAAGIIGVVVGSNHVGTGTNPWPLVPGLAVAGAGLSLLVIPLVNVVLAAVPAETAGGASGLFSTAQQLGGAIGVAVAGTIFFGYLSQHSYQAAFVHTAPYAAGALLVCAILACTLPRTAVTDEGA
jgi:EmrB/QacA subfamily drug resistance transporter